MSNGSRKNIEFIQRNYWKFSLSKIEKVKRTEYSWGGKMVASLVLLPFQLPTRSNSFEARKCSITIKTRLPSSYHAEYGNEIARKSRISRTRYRNAWRWILIRAQFGSKGKIIKASQLEISIMPTVVGIFDSRERERGRERERKRRKKANANGRALPLASFLFSPPVSFLPFETLRPSLHSSTIPPISLSSSSIFKDSFDP